MSALQIMLGVAGWFAVAIGGGHLLGRYLKRAGENSPTIPREPATESGPHAAKARHGTCTPGATAYQRIADAEPMLTPEREDEMWCAIEQGIVCERLARELRDLARRTAQLTAVLNRREQEREARERRSA